MLKVEQLSIRYGIAQVLFELDMEVRPKEIVALIGSNGAGKTTTLRAITGLVRSFQGTIRFKDQDITNNPTYSIMKKGLVHVPQGRQIFPDQTVEDNLILGAYGSMRREKERTKQLVQREFKRFPILASRARQLAGTMSGGEQQMLAISRGLMSEPSFVALDEPSLGLAPLIVKEIMQTIQGMNQEGLTVLLVEQMANAALAIAQRGYVLQNGAIRMSGEGRKLLQDPDVRRTYLGESVTT